jgi:hypothetical protein
MTSQQTTEGASEEDLTNPGAACDTDLSGRGRNIDVLDKQDFVALLVVNQVIDELSRKQHSVTARAHTTLLT